MFSQMENCILEQQDKNLKKRWRGGGGYRNQKAMHEAILKYGWDNIKHIVLISNLKEDMAMEIEKALIEKYSTQDTLYGYNTKERNQRIIFKKYERTLEKSRIKKNLHECSEAKKYVWKKQSYVRKTSFRRIKAENKSKGSRKKTFRRENKKNVGYSIKAFSYTDGFEWNRIE